MPTWTDPITVVDGQVLTGALWNLEVRDKLRALGLSGIQEGEILLGDGANSFSLVDGSGLAAQPGTILGISGHDTPPMGYLHADGSLVSRTTYADLVRGYWDDSSGAGPRRSTLYEILRQSGTIARLDLDDLDNSVRLTGQVPTLRDLSTVEGRRVGVGNIGNTLYGVQSTAADLIARLDLDDLDNSVRLTGEVPNLRDLSITGLNGLGSVGGTLYGMQTAAAIYIARLDLSDDLDNSVRLTGPWYPPAC